LGIIRVTCRSWHRIVSHFLSLFNNLPRLKVTLISMVTEHQPTSLQLSLTNKQQLSMPSNIRTMSLLSLEIKLDVADQ
jgi:hypothetical protein